MYEYQNHLTEPPMPVGGYLPKTISDEELKKIIKDQADMCMAILNGDEKEPPTVKIGDEVIVDGCKGIIIREPYQIGNPDDPLILVLVWYGLSMGDAQLRDVQLTGKEYPEIVKIMEELKKYEEEEV